MKEGRLTAAQFTERYLPEVAVDAVLLSIQPDGKLCTILGRRDEEPFAGAWALPGVFVRRDESLDDAARRALLGKVGVADVFLEQLYTFGDVDRDPRTRIISVSYYALVPHERFAATASGRPDVTIGTLEVSWSGSRGGPVAVLSERGDQLAIAFDHERILGMAVQRIRGKLDYAPIGFELLPAEFTLFDLQRIHESVLGRALNKDSFRRKMLASGLIEDTGARRSGTSFRPAALYRFINEENITHG